MLPVTTFTRTTSRAVPKWRFAIVLLTIAFFGFCASAQAQLSGTYTIGGTGASYSTIDAAIAALNAGGVNGAVTFNINTGTYAPPQAGWVINAINGASSTNRITFKPAAGAVVAITGDIGGYVGATFILNGASYITWDGSNSGGTDRSMTIRNTNVNYMGSHYLRNGASFNVVKNCILQSNGNSISMGPTGYGPTIFIGGTTGTAGNDSNMFQNNQIGDPNGTYRAQCHILMYGQSASYPNKGNKFIGNDIVNFGHSVASSSPSPMPSGLNGGPLACYVYSYNSGTVFQGNDIHMTSSPSYVYCYGIVNYNANGYSPNTVIDRNRIWGFKMPSAYGYTYYYGIADYQVSANVTSTTRITNNFISAAENTPTYFYGIWHNGQSSSTSNRVDVLNNSIHMGGTDPSGYTLYPVYIQYAGLTSQEYFNFRNNIVSNERSGSYGYGLYIYPGAAAPNFSMDYNVLNMIQPTGSSYFGYYYNGSVSGQPNTLAGWQSLTGKDSNSRGGIPQFIDPINGNLHISTTRRTPVANVGQPWGGVTTDIDGDTRSTSTPDIGADEGSFQSVLATDMMAIQLVTPAPPPFNTVKASTAFSPVGVIYNGGTSTATNIVVRYRIWNTTGGVVYNDQRSISSLTAFTTQTITFSSTGSVTGSTSLTPGSYITELRTEWASDQDTSSDALYSTIFVKNPLCGTYTINPGAAQSATNFTSFTGAAADVSALGVTCPVTFLVSGGTYSTTLTGEVFPLPLKAPAGISATNTVTFKPAPGANVTLTGSSSDGIFAIDQGDYYTLDGSNTTGGSTRNWTIENIGSGPAVVFFNGANYNTIKNLSMRANNSANSPTSSGKAGVVSLMVNSSSYPGNSYNVIQNNLIGDTNGVIRSGIGVYMYGGYTTSSSQYCTDNRIDGNDIVNFGSGTSGFGISVAYYLINNLKIFRNQIHMTTTNGSSGVQNIYGIYDYYRPYSPNDTIAYNKIYKLATSYSNPYMYTMYIYQPGASLGSGAANYAIHNNIFSITGGYYHYGLQIQYNYSNIKVAHNTFDHTGASYYYGVYWYQNYGNSLFQNNIMRYTNQYQYMFYMYYLDGGGYGTFAMDRNIYSVGTTTQVPLWMGSTASISGTNLSAWQSLTGKDQNSVLVTSIPFVDAANMDYHIDPVPIFPGESKGAALGFAFDFEGDARSLTFPDIGADEGNFNGGGVRLLSPNGGEQITTGYPFTVSYTTNRPMSVRLEISLDNGATWRTPPAGLVNPTNVGSNTFSVIAPDTVVNTARMRVISQLNQWEADTSDNQFSFVRPIVTILTPNGGEHWTSTDTNRISWSSQFVPPTLKVQLDYSTNNGTTWLPIATNLTSNNLPGTNGYDWIIPNTPTTQALMRVQLVGGTINDKSNSTFTIHPTPSLQLVTPNGNEQWFVGEKRMITWTQVSADYLRMEYTTNGGTSWTTLLDRIPAFLGSYEWTVPNTPTANALVRLTNLERTRFVDQSDGPFSILNSTIQVLGPNGGEKYELNQQVTVNWSSVNVTNVRVEYSPNYGQTWQMVAQAVPAATGSFAFTPTAIPTKLALVRVLNVDRANVMDQSDKPFEIMEAKSISVLSPGEGDQLLRGTTTMINWSAPRVTSVNILYSANGGGVYTTVATNVSAAIGTYVWNVPNALTQQGKIRIQEVGGSTVGESGLFAIVDVVPTTVRVLAPNGGEKFTEGDPIAIRWTNSPDVLSLGISYSTDAGASWSNVAKNVPAIAGQYNWTAPAMPGTEYRVKIDAGAVNDASDANFEVIHKLAPKITVLAPNGGEALTVDSTLTIRWNEQDISGSVNVKYSADGGTIWKDISTVPAGTLQYAWKVPNDTTKMALVMVSTADNKASDTSNATFTITEKVLLPIVLLTPNGGEVWTEKEIKQITWTAPSDITQVDISYSTDNGTTWMLISGSASSGTGTNSYNWTLPQVLPSGTMNALVKVAATSDARFDQSDAPFSIPLSTSSVPNVAVAGTNGVTLMGNYPNPFASRTEIRWTQSVGADVLLRIYEGSGRMVKQVAVGRREVGEQTATVEAGELASGVYFYVLQSGSSSARGMMMVAR